MAAKLIPSAAALLLKCSWPSKVVLHWLVALLPCCRVLLLPGPHQLLQLLLRVPRRGLGV
jgi:hypothetical protein